MKKLLLTALVASCAFTGVSAKEVTFTAATLNVDGMPPSLLNGMVKLNPDAKEGPGASAIGKGIVSTGWDIVALSEDFNYHYDLVAPLTDYYYVGTYRGDLHTKLNVLSSPFDTDGLGLLWTKSFAATNESWTEWSVKYGKTTNGADELIRKGFRYYTVEVAPGMMIDLYIHHMDAEDSPEDNAARASQITQLVNTIKNTHNKRPILIMGDTNCRYTRDDLKNLLYGALSADGRFTVGDPWIDFQWGGNYNASQLQVGQPSLTTSSLGYQKGEVVDKIFYINDAEAEGIRLVPKSYRQAEEFKNEKGEPLSDHYPVTAKFTLIDENDGLATGVEYLVRNIGTHSFINQGNDWGTRSVTAVDGMRIKLESGGSKNTFKFHTTAGYYKPDLYVDGQASESAIFTVKSLPSGYYTLDLNGQNLTSSTSTNYISLSNPNADDALQQWEFITLEAFREELFLKANADNPIDATSLIRGANFNRNDDKSAWNIDKGSKVYVNFGGEQTNELLSIPTSKKGTFENSNVSCFKVSQNLSIPNGIYRLTLQAFSSVPFSTSVFAGEKWINVHSYNSATEDRNAASQAFSRGEYALTIDNIIVTGNSLEIGIQKEGNSGATWSAADNFRLTYLGPTPEMLAAYDHVKAAMDDVAQQLATLEPAARSSFNNSTVEQAYNRHRLVGDGSNEVKLTYQALASAAKSQTSVGADMSSAILNRSFEWAWMAETPNTPSWTTSGSAIANLATNATGRYMLTVYGNNTMPTTQKVTGLPNGVYEIGAMATAEIAGRKVYLVGNGVAGPTVETSDPKLLTAVMTQAIVTDGTLTLGIGACNDAGEALPSQAVGCGYRADDFTLKFTSNLMFQTLDRAIADARKKSFEDGVEVDFSKWQTIADSHSVQTAAEVKKYILEVYQALADAVKANPKSGKDFTNAVINPSFEFADYDGMTGLEGWSYYNGGDTRVINPNTDAAIGTYGVNPVHGSYVFNTWVEGYRGYPLTQILRSMPEGTYRIQAKIASDVNNRYFVMGNGTHGAPVITTDKGTFIEGSHEFFHPGGNMTIAIRSSETDTYDPNGMGWWYKADDFRLTYVNPKLTPMTLIGNYNTDTQTLSIDVEPYDSAITIMYLVKEDEATPAEDDFMEIYTSPIDMTQWAGKTVHVWAKASGEGYTPISPVRLASATVPSNGTQTGIYDIEVGSKTEYYNLQGVRVLKPGRGLYILKNGDKTMKVIL